ncbi:MAG: glycosyltransferase [Hyphomonas sp.]|nr:glycosyltransferase [Hyphomonas sp.]MCB9970023.1 glycosyltransferase [Hyphomonas sp.]
MGQPKVSIIIISFDMAREVPRTVQSFLPPYQQGISNNEVEIIVLENGSSHPVSEADRAQWPDNVRYLDIDTPHPSPARALNFGVSVAKGDIVCPVIDGARMASPGLVSTALDALRYSSHVFAASVGYHLGEKSQQQAVLDGYNQTLEDELLASISWPENGYRLYEICAPAGSSPATWFGRINESNAPFLSRAMYDKIGGFEERFSIPGGGLVNLDFFDRAVSQSDFDYLLLLGEATFHQFHGGVTTSKSVQLKEADGETTWTKYLREYEAIRGTAYRPPERLPTIFGKFPPGASGIAKRGLDYLAGASS